MHMAHVFDPSIQSWILKPTLPDVISGDGFVFDPSIQSWILKQDLFLCLPVGGERFRPFDPVVDTETLPAAADRHADQPFSTLRSSRGY